MWVIGSVSRLPFSLRRTGWSRTPPGDCARIVRKDIGGSGGGGRDERADGAHVAGGVAVTAKQWRTREDPFADVWLGDSWWPIPTAGSKLCRHPGRFQAGQLRTLQRRVRDWRVQYGPDREVYFEQVASGSGSGVRLHRRERPGRRAGRGRSRIAVRELQRSGRTGVTFEAGRQCCDTTTCRRLHHEVKSGAPSRRGFRIGPLRERDSRFQSNHHRGYFPRTRIISSTGTTR